MEFSKYIQNVPLDYIAAIKSFQNDFRIKLLLIFKDSKPLSLSQIQKQVLKENSYILNHLNQLEMAGIVKNFIQKQENVKEYSFYEFTKMGRIFFMTLLEYFPLSFKLDYEKMANEITSLTKAIGNKFRFALLLFLQDQKKAVSFTYLIECTKQTKSSLTLNLKKLEKSHLIQNQYLKQPNENTYSYYSITDYGKDILTKLVTTYNMCYQKSSKPLKTQEIFSASFSNWALPNESILGWIQIFSDEIQKIEISYSENLQIKHLYNKISSSDHDENSKRVIIPNISDQKINYIPIEFFSTIPMMSSSLNQEEVQIIAYNKNQEPLKKESFKIEIINPIIKMEANKNQITAKTGYVDLKIILLKGYGIIINVLDILVLDQYGNEIQMKSDNKEPEDLPNDLPPEITINNLIGKLEFHGNGPYTLKFRIKYSDLLGNNYFGESNEIIIENPAHYNNLFNFNYSFEKGIYAL